MATDGQREELCVWTVQALTEDDVNDEGDATGQKCALGDGHTGVLQVSRDISTSCMTQTIIHKYY